MSVIVVQSSGNAIAQEVTIGKDRITVDEPPDVGGGGAGPTPYELLTAALGS